jgi:hypothetical protein
MIIRYVQAEAAKDLFNRFIACTACSISDQINYLRVMRVILTLPSSSIILAL